jgi:hypothetical protein
MVSSTCINPDSGVPPEAVQASCRSRRGVLTSETAPGTMSTQTMVLEKLESRMRCFRQGDLTSIPFSVMMSAGWLKAVDVWLALKSSCLAYAVCSYVITQPEYLADLLTMKQTTLPSSTPAAPHRFSGSLDERFPAYRPRYRDSVSVFT